jgi:tRNA nucleotidyltransferase (CCA-adding enzyme)
LRYSKHETNCTVRLVVLWRSAVIEWAAPLERGAPSDARARRWLSQIGRLRAGGFLRIASARWSAARALGLDAPDARAVRTLHRQLRRSLFLDPIEIADLAVGGDELRAAGIPAGPIYAKILDALLEWVLEDPARNTREALLAELPRILAELGEEGADDHSSTDS